MSQEHFDDLLRQSFDEERAIPFDEDGWMALENQLPKKRRYILPLWFLLLLGSGWLLAGLLFFLNDKNNTESVKINTPATEIKSAAEVNQIDTVYLKEPEIIIQRDTIIQYIHSPSFDSELKLQNKTNSSETKNLPIALTPTSTTIDPPFTNTTIASPPIEEKQQGQIITDNIGPNKKAPSVQFATAPFIPKKSTILVLEAPAEVVFSNTANKGYKKQYKPLHWTKDLYVGVHYGDGRVADDKIPTTVYSGFSSATLDNSIQVLNNKYVIANADTFRLAPVGLRQYGVEVGYDINRFITVNAQIGREAYSFDHYNEGISSFRENNDEINLEGAYEIEYDSNNTGTNNLFTTQKAMYYELGTRVRLPWRISPILQSSLRMRSHITRNSEFQSRSLTADAQSVQLNTFNEQDRVNKLRIEHLKLGTGLAWRLSPRLELQSSFNTYMKLRKEVFLQPDWTLNIGLNYRFR